MKVKEVLFEGDLSGVGNFRDQRRPIRVRRLTNDFEIVDSPRTLDEMHTQLQKVVYTLRQLFPTPPGATRGTKRDS